MALYFATVSYGVLTLRALLATPDAGDVLSLKRLATAVVGTGAFLLARRDFTRARSEARPWLMTVLLWAVAASALVLASRLAATWLSSGRAGLTPFDDMRCVLLWDGYFFAALFAWPGYSPLARAETPVLKSRTPTPADISGCTALSEIWVQRRGLTLRVEASQIEFVEAEGNYIRVHFDGTDGVLRAPLKALTHLLDAAAFVRIHRSILCRRSLIAAVRRLPTGALRVVLPDGRELPVGRTFTSNLPRGTRLN